MSIILDAYNVLHATHVLPDRFQELTAPQIGALVERAGMTRGTIYVVCDGSRKPMEIAEPNVVQVEVIYAGAGRDADSVIEDLIEDAAQPQDLVVVSNDHRIQRAARRRRAKILSSESFLHKLYDALRDRTAGPAGPEKPTGPVDAEPWMEKFGYTGGADEKNEPRKTKIRSEADVWMKEFGIEE